MNELDKTLASIRGEALAANLIATAALQTIVMMMPNNDELLKVITDFIDETLNRSRPKSGDARDEVNNRTREVARSQAMQIIDQLKRKVASMPGG